MRAAWVAVLVLATVPAVAGDVPPEVHELDGQKITLHPAAFLTKEDLTVLRLVATNSQALSVFVPTANGFTAIAVAPKEGFVRGGAPVPSATAIGGLADSEAARKAALEGCDKARKTKTACEVVLEIAPAG
jgi:hypothetical protein